MERHQFIRPASRWLYIVSLFLLVVAYRLFSADYPLLLSNTAPVMAMCFGGGLLLGRRYWWVPALMMIGSDVALGLAGGSGLGSYTIFTVIFFTVIAFAAAQFGRRSKWRVMFGGTLLCSLLFYLAANTFSWISMAGIYPQTLAGWWQSQTTGLPEFSPPAWVFLRNALIGDSVWCAVAGLLFFFQGRFAVKRAETAPVA